MDQAILDRICREAHKFCITIVRQELKAATPEAEARWGAFRHLLIDDLEKLPEKPRVAMRDFIATVAKNVEEGDSLLDAVCSMLRERNRSYIYDQEVAKSIFFEAIKTAFERAELVMCDNNSVVFA